MGLRVAHMHQIHTAAGNVLACRGAVIETALTGQGITGLFKAGWTTIKVRPGQGGDHVACQYHACITGPSRGSINAR